MMKSKITLSLLVLIFYSVCFAQKKQLGYKPDDKKLYDTIVHLDSLFFAAYNNCDVNLETHAAFYADSVEFYHDKTLHYRHFMQIV